MPKTRSVEGLSVGNVARVRTCQTFPWKFHWTKQNSKLQKLYLYGQS